MKKTVSCQTKALAGRSGTERRTNAGIARTNRRSATLAGALRPYYLGDEASHDHAILEGLRRQTTPAERASFADRRTWVPASVMFGDRQARRRWLARSFRVGCLVTNREHPSAVQAVSTVQRFQSSSRTAPSTYSSVEVTTKANRRARA